VSGSGISWAISKSAPRSRQITMPAPHHSVFYRPDALPAAQPTASKHGRQTYVTGKWAELLQTHFSTAGVCHDNEHHSKIRLTCIASSISRPVGFFAREISRRNRQVKLIYNKYTELQRGLFRMFQMTLSMAVQWRLLFSARCFVF